jgi:hypothetical protein
VELKRSAKRCPLCGVEVILPAALRDTAEESDLPQQRDVVPSDFDKNLWIQVVSALMVTPALISIVVDAVFGGGLTWSLYVVVSLAAAWVWGVSPFLYNRNIVPLWLAIDAAAMLGLLYVVNALSPTSGWFLPLALPITLCLALLTLLVVELIRRKVLQELHIVSAVLTAIGIFCLVVETAVDLYLTDHLELQWSLLVLVSCMALSLIATILQQRREFVEGMKIWFRM